VRVVDRQLIELGQHSLISGKIVRVDALPYVARHREESKRLSRSEGRGEVADRTVRKIK
jgi:hypothetical protein